VWGIIAVGAVAICWFASRAIPNALDEAYGDVPNVPRELRPARKTARGEVVRASERAAEQVTIAQHDGTDL
jgi:hypothetical protein